MSVQREWVVHICPRCGGQGSEASQWHSGDCANRDKVFARESIEVIRKPDEAAADRAENAAVDAVYEQTGRESYGDEEKARVAARAAIASLGGWS